MGCKNKSAVSTLHAVSGVAARMTSSDIWPRHNYSSASLAESRIYINHHKTIQRPLFEYATSMFSKHMTADVDMSILDIWVSVSKECLHTPSLKEAKVWQESLFHVTGILRLMFFFIFLFSRKEKIKQTTQPNWQILVYKWSIHTSKIVNDFLAVILMLWLWYFESLRIQVKYFFLIVSDSHYSMPVLSVWLRSTEAKHSHATSLFKRKWAVAAPILADILYLVF